MTFPSIQSAFDYLQVKVSEFYRQGDVLTDRLRKVGQLLKQAQATNDQESMGKLILMKSQVQDLLQQHIALEQQIKPFAEYFGITTPQLGLLPLVLAGVAVGVAALLYVHFEKIQAQKQALELIAQGMLKPSDAQAILSGGGFFSGLSGMFSNIGLVAFLAGGAYLYFAFGRRRAS